MIEFVASKSKHTMWSKLRSFFARFHLKIKCIEVEDDNARRDRVDCPQYHARGHKRDARGVVSSVAQQ